MHSKILLEIYLLMISSLTCRLITSYCYVDTDFNIQFILIFLHTYMKTCYIANMNTYSKISKWELEAMFIKTLSLNS